ncbi:23S rRNA (adenine(1618)-N(6))-methyltransferase RlmF [Limibacter armeniacum]|uniref:23S rRNA (adenine(1618)-N(6))-methyltransferase RlmF n=1 Tax=Limibacter armeniacum TaxID=466084 RepID=UPI002FE5267A
MQKQKPQLHPRNQHKQRYDFSQLIKACPELENYTLQNPHGEETINFSDPDAVKVLNCALLSHHYGIKYWDIPEGYLCPPIPGRADYLHYLADLLATCNGGKIPEGNQIRGLDIGVGANCIYPLLGNSLYGWSFVGAELEPDALQSAENIVKQNGITDIALRLQPSAAGILDGVWKEDEKFHFTICNPPFHASEKEAEKANQRRLTKQGGEKATEKALNFGGQSRELWCKGGEALFLKKMVKQSATRPQQCIWFTSLVSKKDTLPDLYKHLKKAKAKDIRTIEMGHGNKLTRFVAWTFLDAHERKI